MISSTYLLMITFLLSIGQVKLISGSELSTNWAAHQDKTSFLEALQSLEGITEDTIVSSATIDAIRAYEQSYGGASSALAHESSSESYGNQRSGSIKGSTFRTSTIGKSGSRSGYGQRSSPPSTSLSNANSYNQATGKTLTRTSGSGVYRTSNSQSSIGQQSPRYNSGSSGTKVSSTSYRSPASAAVAKGYGFASTGSKPLSKSSYGVQPVTGSGYGASASGGSVNGRGGISRSNRPSFTETVTSLGPSTSSYNGGNNVGSPMGDIDRRSFDFGGEKRGVSYGSASGQSSYGTSSSSSSSSSSSGMAYGSAMASGSNYGGQSSDTGSSYGSGDSSGGSGSSGDYGSDDGTDGLSAFGNPGVDFPIFSSLPETGFSCTNRLPGYYADTGAGCQPFYICQADGRQDGFLCPNATLFNQEVFVCDWWFNVDCSMAESFYALNGNLFQESGNSGYGQGSGGSGYGGSDAGGSGYGSRSGTDGGQVSNDYDNGSSGQGYGEGRDSGNVYGSGGQSSTESYSSGSGLKRPSPSGQYDSPFRFGDTAYNSDNRGFGSNDGQVRMSGSGRRGTKGQTFNRPKSADAY